VSRRYRTPLRESLGRAGVLALAGVLGLVVALPLLALLFRATPTRLFQALRDPGVLQSLRLSLETSVLATILALLLGLPMAYLLATREFRGKRVLEVLMDLPIVIPPTVAGFALLMAFGRAGLLGKSLTALGITLPFSTAGVVLAQLFMSVPFLVGAARAGFQAVDPRYLDAAATLRAGEMYTLWRVRLPLALPSIVAGTGMAWARALGEFGATITFAGNMAGTTRTVPLDVYLRLNENLDAAATLSLLLIVMAAVLLAAMRQAGLGLFAPPRAPRIAPAPGR
jgi:molybdate transport system permease protein